MSNFNWSIYVSYYGHAFHLCIVATVRTIRTTYITEQSVEILFVVCWILDDECVCGARVCV